MLLRILYNCIIMGAPLLDDRDLQLEFIQAVRDGAPVGTACRKVGISHNTYRAYVKKATEHEDPNSLNYLQHPLAAAFVEQVRRAQAEDEIMRLKRISRHAENDWRADAWYLSRVNPETYGEKSSLQLTGDGGGPVKIEFLPDGVSNVRDAGDANGSAVADTDPDDSE
jgi:hypothetical protein